MFLLAVHLPIGCGEDGHDEKEGAEDLTSKRVDSLIILKGAGGLVYESLNNIEGGRGRGECNRIWYHGWPYILPYHKPGSGGHTDVLPDCSGRGCVECGSLCLVRHGTLRGAADSKIFLRS